MRRPPVSLILPNRNNGPVLDLTLHRLLRHTTYPDFERVVVDDGSTDASRRILRRWRDERRFPSFTLLEREQRGAAAALNDALAHAGGELVVQLDGDATVR
jgi:glycosyltransferase involved in cell wall biosynthesis